MKWKLPKWTDGSEDYENSAGNPLYNRVELAWRRPTIWKKTEKAPEFDDSEAFLYALVRNHGKFRDKDRIEYIGLTASPKQRFGNHETARSIVSQHGQVSFTYAPINIQGRNRIDRIKSALEDIEHLLIWSVPDCLWNQQKVMRLPGMGSRGSNAWHIINAGYRFSGRMPKEILYPGLLLAPGRDRSIKPEARRETDVVPMSE